MRVVLLALALTGCSRFGFTDPLEDAPQAGDVGGDDHLGDADSGDANPNGAAFPVGDVLFAESFDDTNFAERGWYDVPDGTLDSSTVAPQSSSSFYCLFDDGRCAGGRPGRVHFAATDSVHISYWVKYPANFEGALEIFLHNTEDRDTVGPADSRLGISFSTDITGGGYIRFEDNDFVDVNCVRISQDDSVVGCAGFTFETYPFDEDRSVCSCNGTRGFVDEHECFQTGPSSFFSRRYWHTSEPVVTDTEWHFVELYFEMNSIDDGVGVPDGVIGYALDGERLIYSENILLRTGAVPDLQFKHILFQPVYGADGQGMWLDELVISQGG